jgi:hypothetical protein
MTHHSLNHEDHPPGRDAAAAEPASRRTQQMTRSTTDSTVSRRAALAGLGAGSLGLALATTTRHAAAQDATPFPMAGHPIVGTWIVDRNPDDQTDSPTINVFTADGSVFDPLLAVGGAWQATGPRSATVTLLGLIDGGAGGYIAIRSAIEVDETGTTIAGPHAVTIVAPDGTVLNTIQGHGGSTRLVVEGPEAAGTPLPGVPKWTPVPSPDATPAA